MKAYITRIKQAWVRLRSEEATRFGAVDWLMLGGGLTAFAAVTLGNISRWSVWFDEAFGIYLIRFSYADVAKYTATDVHPPLYYWLLKLWQSLFGSSEVALRSLSMIAIMVAMVLLVLFVRRYFGRLAAGVSVAMMALTPLMVRYGEEARMYGVALLIVVSATILLARLSERPSLRGYIYYGLLVALGMWTHYFTAVMWLTHWAWRWWAVRGSTARRTAGAFWTKQWVLAHVVAIGLYAPWLPIMLQQMKNVQNGGFWISSVAADTPLDFLTSAVTYRNSGDVTGWLTLAVWLLVILGVGLMGRALRTMRGVQRRYYGLMLMMMTVPMLLLMLLSMPPLRPAFVERYLVPSLPFIGVALGVAVAVGWHEIRRSGVRRMATAAALLFAGVSMAGLVHLYQIGNFNKHTDDPLLIRPLMQQIQAVSPSGQPLVSQSSWRFYEAHYYQTDIHPVYFEATDDLTWGSYDMLRHNEYRKVRDTADFALQHGRRIWYIGDWERGKPALPRQGSWRVMREVEAEGSGPGSAFRAVEVELMP